MRWQEIKPDSRLETFQEEGFISVAVVAVDDKVAPLAIVLRLRLREEHLIQSAQRYLGA